jgi:ubiquinone/menaquinone biosynthesis C-methylase UbiE
MFTESGKYYDILYSWKDYAKEASGIYDLIRGENPKARTVLDVACGTAEHHLHLGKHFEMEGLDLDEGLLRIAQQKLPEGVFHIGDMTAFDLGKKYDAVMCMFSSIGYVGNKAKLDATLACFAHHLQPEGVVIVEPWFQPSQLKPGKVSMITHDAPDIKICRMSWLAQEGNQSHLDFHYLVAQEGQGVRTLEERHTLALFTEDDMRSAFAQAGLRVTYDPKGLTGRGLYIGRRIG